MSDISKPSNPILDLQNSLRERCENAKRSAKSHPDLQSRRDASVRVQTYEMVLHTMETNFSDPKKFAIVSVQESDESEDEVRICTGDQLLAMPVPLARRLAIAIMTACDFSEIDLRNIS